MNIKEIYELENPILKQGEIVIVPCNDVCRGKDINLVKLGDGKTHYNDIPYGAVAGSGISGGSSDTSGSLMATVTCGISEIDTATMEAVGTSNKTSTEIYNDVMNGKYMLACSIENTEFNLPYNIYEYDAYVSSELYKKFKKVVFTSISKVPALEINTVITLTIDETGKCYLQMSEDTTSSSGGSSSGSNVYIINVSLRSSNYDFETTTGTCTADRTFAEIQEAYNNGYYPVVYLSFMGVKCYATLSGHFPDDDFKFVSISYTDAWSIPATDNEGIGVRSIVINADNTITISANNIALETDKKGLK